MSCDARAQAELNRSLALLHHMAYVQAREAFRGVASRDPGPLENRGGELLESRERGRSPPRGCSVYRRTPRRDACAAPAKLGSPAGGVIVVVLVVVVILRPGAVAVTIGAVLALALLALGGAALAGSRGELDVEAVLSGLG